MARAHSVHLVVGLNADVGLGVIAAFTVKHECASWLERRDSVKGLAVCRVPDGGGEPNRVITAQEFLAG